jgi:hypothetical protein
VTSNDPEHRASVAAERRTANDSGRGTSNAPEYRTSVESELGRSVTSEHRSSVESERRIYVDIDDVLCQTAASLIDLLEQHHDRRVDYEDLLQFDLGRSFGLDEGELAEFMDEAHRAEVIEAIAPIEGAASALQAWTAQEYDVVLLTGRPPATEEATRGLL